MKHTISRVISNPKSPTLYFHGVGTIKKKEITVTTKVNAQGEIGAEIERAMELGLSAEKLAEVAIKGALKVATRVQVGGEVAISGTYEILYLHGFAVTQLLDPPPQQAQPPQK